MESKQLRRAVEPDEVRASLRTYADELSHAADAHHGGQMADVRTAQHAGHEIVVRTSYEITVDGVPFDVHLSVGNNGRVHYHGLPTRDFGSVIDLVAKAIDRFGDEFVAATDPAGPVQPDPHGDHHDGHHDDQHDHGGEH